jgi:transposase-like protein
VARIKSRKALAIEVKRGRPSTGLAPSKEDLVRLYVREKKSIREIAQQLGRSKDIVYRTLKQYGFEVRTNVKRSRLREYSLNTLESGVKQKGIRGLARELGVDESTLRHHMKVRKGN